MDITPETGSSRNRTSTSSTGGEGPRTSKTEIAGDDAVERDHGSRQATSSGSRDVIMTDSVNDRKSEGTIKRTGGAKRAATDGLSEGEGHEVVLAEDREGTVSGTTKIEPPPAAKRLKIAPKDDEFIRNPPCHKCKELEIPCIGVEARTSCNQCFRRHWKCTLEPPPARRKRLRNNAISASALKDLDAFGVSSRSSSLTQDASRSTRQVSSTPAPSAGSTSTRDSANTSQTTSAKSGPVTRPLVSVPMPKRRTPRIAMPTLPFDPSRIPSRDKGKAPVRSPVHYIGSDSLLTERRANPRRNVSNRAPLRFDSDSEEDMNPGPSTRKSSTPAPKNHTKALIIDTDSVSKFAGLGFDSDSPLSSVPSSRCPSPDFTTAGASNSSPPTSTHSPITPSLKLPVNAALPTIVSSFNTLTGLFHTMQSDIGDIKELTASTIGSHSALEWGVAVQRLDKQDKLLRQQGAMIEKQGRIIDALMNNMKDLLGEKFVAADYDVDMHESTADLPAQHEANSVNEDGASFPDVRSGSYEPSEPFRASAEDTFRLSAEPESSISDSSFSQQSSFGAATSNTSMTSVGLSQERASLEPDVPSQSKRTKSRISRTFSPSTDGASPPPLTSSQPSQPLQSQSQSQPSQPKTASSQSSQPKSSNDNNRPKLLVAHWNADTNPVGGDDSQEEDIAIADESPTRKERASETTKTGASARPGSIRPTTSKR